MREAAFICLESFIAFKFMAWVLLLFFFFFFFLFFGDDHVTGRVFTPT